VTLYFEDFPAGTELELGSWTPSAGEITAFADRWDPRPEGLAGAAASGWLGVCKLGGLYVDVIAANAASMGGGGFEDIRFRAPLRAGHPLRAVMHVLEATPSKTRPERGTMFWEGSFRDGDGLVVLSLRARAFFRRRGT
jgi:acyl dehydratase